MTSMRHYVAWTSLRRHVPAGNLAPPLAPQYSKPWPPQYSKPSYENGWLVYHGCFELVLESLGRNPIAADIIIFGIEFRMIFFLY